MNSNDTKFTNDIIRETAIHDYVAGHMDEERRSAFQAMISRDQQLASDVKAEQKLRSTLLEFSNEFAQQRETDGDIPHELNALINAGEDTSSNADLASNGWFPVLLPNKYSAIAIAASVFAGVFFSLQFFTSTFQFLTSNSHQDFNLLSNQTTAQASFVSAIQANRVAQIWVVPGLQQAEIEALFAKFKLSPVSRAGDAWVVALPGPLMADTIIELENSSQVEQVELLSFVPATSK